MWSCQKLQRPSIIIFNLRSFKNWSYTKYCEVQHPMKTIGISVRKGKYFKVDVQCMHDLHWLATTSSNSRIFIYIYIPGMLKPVGKVWWMKRPLALLRQNHSIRGNVRLHLGIRISSFLIFCEVRIRWGSINSNPASTFTKCVASDKGSGGEVL